MFKALVGSVYILEVAQIALLTQTAWMLTVSGFGNIEAFNIVGTTWISVAGIEGLGMHGLSDSGQSL